jgi:hypothetical protein
MNKIILSDYEKKLSKEELVMKYLRVINKLNKRIDYLEGEEFYDSVITDFNTINKPLKKYNEE